MLGGSYCASQLQTVIWEKMKIELQNITATEEGLYEYEEDKVLVFVPKNEIKKLSLGFGTATRWLMIARLLGVALICIGILFGVLPIIRTIISGANIGFSFLKGYGLISLWIIFGYYLLRSGLRKQNVLILNTNKGIRKLAITGSVEKKSIEDFLNESSEKFRYPI